MNPFNTWLYKTPFLNKIYHRLKASFLYDLYFLLKDKDIIMERNNEIKFYKDLLHGFKKGNLVYDVGANHGYKTDIFLRLGANIIAIDPDEYNREILELRFLKFRFKKKPVTIVDKAVSDQNSVLSMWVEEPGSAKNTLSQKWVDALKSDSNRFDEYLTFNAKKDVQTTTLTDLINTYGHPFFIKIDVEGHELNVLKGLKQPVPFLSFEVNLPEFKEEGVQCIELLGELNENGEFNYSAHLSRGFYLEKWLRLGEFLIYFNECKEKSIEVFWRTQELNETK